MSNHVHCCDEVDQESVEAQAVEAWLQSPEAEARLEAALKLREWSHFVGGYNSDIFAREILAAMRDSTPTP